MRTKNCPLSGGVCFALGRESHGLDSEYFPYPQLTRKTRTASVTKMIVPSSKNDKNSKIQESKKKTNLTCKSTKNTNTLVSRNFDKAGKRARANLGSQRNTKLKEGKHDKLCYGCCSRIPTGPHNVMTQTSVDTSKWHHPALKKAARIVKRDVCLMANDSSTYDSPPDKSNYHLLKPHHSFGQFSESTANGNELADTRNHNYLFESNKKKKLTDLRDRSPYHQNKGNDPQGDGFAKSTKPAHSAMLAGSQCHLNEDDQFVNLVLNGGSSKPKRNQEITHLAEIAHSNETGQCNNLKEKSQFAHGNALPNAFPDKDIKEEVVQALRNEKKEFFMHIHKAQGKVTEIRFRLMELSKAVNSKASVDDNNERLFHAGKLDRMLDETIKELAVLSKVMPSNSAGNAATGDSSVTKNGRKPSGRFDLKDLEKRTKTLAKEILANSFTQSKKSTDDRSKRDSPAPSTSTTTTDVSSLSALQSELCSFFAAMKIQTDRLIEEAENHHEALLNYGNPRLGASCSSDLSSIISGFA